MAAKESPKDLHHLFVSRPSGVERLLDEVSFDAPNRSGQTVRIDAAAVDAKLAELSKNEDLSRYIL